MFLPRCTPSLLRSQERHTKKTSSRSRFIKTIPELQDRDNNSLLKLLEVCQTNKILKWRVTGYNRKAWSSL